MSGSGSNRPEACQPFKRSAKGKTEKAFECFFMTAGREE